MISFIILLQPQQRLVPFQIYTHPMRDSVCPNRAGVKAVLDAPLLRLRKTRSKPLLPALFLLEWQILEATDMKRPPFFILLWSVLITSGCATQPKLISDVDGCKTYRFYDQAWLQAHYFTKCDNGTVQETKK